MARQRFGQGIRGCLNINNWNHFFSPNSQSAIDGAEACMDHWARAAQKGGSVRSTPTLALGIERYAKPDLTVDKHEAETLTDARNLVGPPDFTPLVVAAVVVVLAYLIWK